jgi:hypothetical protein
VQTTANSPIPQAILRTRGPAVNANIVRSPSWFPTGRDAEATLRVCSLIPQNRHHRYRPPEAPNLRRFRQNGAIGACFIPQPAEAASDRVNWRIGDEGGSRRPVEIGMMETGTETDHPARILSYLSHRDRRDA